MEKSSRYSATSEELELMSRAAWLYYIAQLNQGEVATRLGITRARANKLLQMALDNGLVTITIDHSYLGSLKMENEICEVFGLKNCYVVPSQESESSSLTARKAVGAKAATLIKNIIEKKPDAVIGLGWGRTLVSMVRQMEPANWPNVKFISLMGSLTPSTAVNPFEVIQSIANIVGAQGYFLPVPFIADSIENRVAFITQRIVQDAIKLARSTDFAFISVGELTDSSLLFTTSMLNLEDLDSLHQAGAVGDTNGIFFDLDGQPVAHDLNNRTISVRFEHLKDSHVTLLAAGLEKINATSALLKSGVVDEIVIDEKLAEAILKNT